MSRWIELRIGPSGLWAVACGAYATLSVNGLRELVMRGPFHEHRFSTRAASTLTKVRALLSWFWGRFRQRPRRASASPARP